MGFFEPISWSVNLTPEERRKWRHAELLDQIGLLNCQAHTGEHGAWRAGVLIEIHARLFGDVHRCEYCLDNSMKDIMLAHKRPSFDPHDPEIARLAREFGANPSSIRVIGEHREEED